MFFKEFLFGKEKKFFFLTNILNFLFILLPLCFFFSHMVVNTFCLIFCIYSFFLFYSINLRIIFDKLDKILLFFFCFLSTQVSQIRRLHLPTSLMKLDL